MDADFVLYPSIDVRIAHDFMEELNKQQRVFVMNLCVEHKIYCPLPEQGKTNFYLSSYDFARGLPPFQEVSIVVMELYVMELYKYDLEQFQRQYGYWN